MDIAAEIKKTGFEGDIDSSPSTIDTYSHDASMFEMRPELVVFPKHSQDVQRLVKFVADAKSHGANLSLTARSAGTDMSGGAINDSIVMDMTRYFNKIYEVTSDSARTQPGVFYRDFELETLKHDAIMPSYPASRDLCTVGGMVANNAGGEKSLEHGKTEKFIKQLSVVFGDGNEYVVKPLNADELRAKIAQNDYEASIYKKIYDICEQKHNALISAKPKVTKDSTGYHVWNVWDRETGVFDLTQLIVGSQGTLGFVTEITFRLVPAPKHSGTLVVFLRDISNLGDLIKVVVSKKPATFEGFDNYTLILSFKLFFYFHKTLGWLGMFKLAIQLIPDALMLFRGVPKMVLLVEFNGNTPEEVATKIHNMRQELRPFSKKALFEEDETEAKAKKFWIMRRQSFNLLRSKVKDKHTAPYIDDLVVNPEFLPKFLPELRKILKKYKLLATIAGHMGDGNFHVIPLMEFEKASDRDKIQPSMKEVNDLVLKYGGSLSGEHNDGLSRGPWLRTMYSPEVFDIFADIKHTFDPTNIFNPHKKTDADWEFSMQHLRQHF